MKISKYITAMVASTLLMVGGVANGAGMVDDSYNDALSKLVQNMKTAVAQEVSNLNSCTATVLSDCPLSEANTEGTNAQTISGVSNKDATYNCEATATDVTCTAAIEAVLGYDGSPALVAAVEKVTSTASYVLTSNNAVGTVSCVVTLTGKARQSELASAFATTNTAIAAAAKGFAKSLGCSTTE